MLKINKNDSVINNKYIEDNENLTHIKKLNMKEIKFIDKANAHEVKKIKNEKNMHEIDD